MKIADLHQTAGVHPFGKYAPQIVFERYARDISSEARGCKDAPSYVRFYASRMLGLCIAYIIGATKEENSAPHEIAKDIFKRFLEENKAYLDTGDYLRQLEAAETAILSGREEIDVKLKGGRPQPVSEHLGLEGYIKKLFPEDHFAREVLI